MKTVYYHWDRFWFEPKTPLVLCVNRILFFGILLFFHRNHSLSRISWVPEVFWNPIPLFSFLNLGVFDAKTLEILCVVWKFSLFMSMAGLLTRVSTLTCAILSTYIYALNNCFSVKNFHSAAPILIVMFLLALSRCGDSLSIDRWLKERKFFNTAKDGEYTWPVKGVWLVMSVAFFCAAVSKLKGEGLGWISSDGQRMLFLTGNYWASEGVFRNIALEMIHYPTLLTVSSAFALGVEFFFPLAMFHWLPRIVLVFGAALMQISIRLFLGPNFIAWISLYIFWIPWDKVFALFNRSRN